MGLFENIKNIMTIPPEEDEFEETYEEVEEAPKKKPVSEPVQQKREAQPRILGGGKSKTVNFNINQMQVILVKPDRYEDSSAIADHLTANKTIVLNLESCESSVSRRIVDFLSGAAYAIGGNVRKVAVSTFIIVPNQVDIQGEVSLEEFGDTSMYF
ncbi:MAG: cell division protein SepF [Clostridia bacterium]|nr:cell division protein SepF [Clostridia bacterium]